MHKLIHMMATIFTYVCPRCHQILQFDRPSVPKCPKCGVHMTQK